MPSLVEISPVVLEKKISKFLQYIFTISILSPLLEGWGPSLEQFELPSPREVLCQVWLKLVQWDWKRRFLNIFNIILHFCYYFPLKKGLAIHLNKHESPSSKDTLCQVWLKLGQWFLRRRFLNILDRNLLFRYYLPLEKDVALHLNKLESPSAKDALC